jgi:hypothetical protein
MNNPKGSIIWPYAAALAAAILSGIIEMRQTELLITVVFILATGVAIGIVWWKQSWKYGLVIGLGVPIAYVLAPVFGWHPTTHAQPNAIIAFAALLPGVTGAATGAMLRIAYDEGKAKRA